MAARDRRQRREARIRALIERDGPRCFYCRCAFGPGKRMPTLDHVLARREGGRSHLDNLRLVCAKCNGRKGHRSIVEFEQSRAFALRRAAIEHEKAPPKRWFNHRGLVWFGKDRWFCSDCGATSATQSPTRVVCAAQQPVLPAGSKGPCTSTDANGWAAPQASGEPSARGGSESRPVPARRGDAG